MKSTKSAIRYAKALLEMSIEQNIIDAILFDMQRIVTMADGSKEFVVFLNSPVVKSDKKILIIEKLLPKLQPLSSAFISLLTKNGRAPILHFIASGFVSLVEQHRGIISGTITSAVALSEESRKKILSKLAATIPGELKLTEKINPALIGGFIITIGDKQIDTSVSQQLKNLRQELTQ
jgi:F-type H+-transporting ATPase subunit delta